MDRMEDREHSDTWDDNDEDLPKSTCKEIVNGIDIKDLCDGKEVIFEMSSAKTEDAESDEDFEDFVHYELKSMREKRKAPALTKSFKELASKMTDVTENGFVKKQIISFGAGKVVPDYSYVTVHYNLYKESSELPFDSTYMRNRPEKFRLGQSEVILGLDYAIKTMKKNENSMFFIKWEYAFGAMGCPERIEPKCNIVADITLLSFAEINSGDEMLALLTQPEAQKIDFSQSIAQVKRFIFNGNDEFNKKNANAACVCYRKALKILNNLRLSGVEEETEMLRQKMKCLVNLAVCYNHLNLFEVACLICQEALSVDSSNAKAHFHLGKAKLGLSQFSESLKHLKIALKLKPNDPAINSELKKLNNKKALYEVKDKIFWTKALNGSSQKESSLNSFDKELKKSLENSQN